MAAKKATLKKAQPKTSTKNFHNYKIDNSKSVQDCIEIATVDAYDEYEQTNGWHCSLEEVFDGVSEVEFLGEIVKFVKFDFHGDSHLIGVIKKNGKTAKVSIESLHWIKPTKQQSLWHKAYLEFHGGLN